jgi:hypothetical protein
VSYAAILLFSEGPYVVLAALGIVLFKRHRTLATGLLALGFVAVAISQLLGIYGHYAATQILSFRWNVRGVTFGMVHLDS